MLKSIEILDKQLISILLENFRIIINLLYVTDKNTVLIRFKHFVVASPMLTNRIVLTLETNKTYSNHFNFILIVILQQKLFEILFEIRIK